MKLIEAMLKLNNLAKDTDTVTYNLEYSAPVGFGCNLPSTLLRESDEKKYKDNLSSMRELVAKYYALQEDILSALLKNKISFVGTEMSLLAALFELKVFTCDRGTPNMVYSPFGEINTLPCSPFVTARDTFTPLNSIINSLSCILSDEDAVLGKKYFTFYGYEKEKLNVTDKYVADLKTLVYDALANVEI